MRRSNSDKDGDGTGDRKEVILASNTSRFLSVIINKVIVSVSESASIIFPLKFGS